MEQLATIFGAVEKLSPFGFFVRVLGVAVLLYLPAGFCPGARVASS